MSGTGGELKRNDAQMRRLMDWYVVQELSAAQVATAFNKHFPTEPPMTRNAVTTLANRKHWGAMRPSAQKAETSNVPVAPRAQAPERKPRRVHAVTEEARPIYICVDGHDGGLQATDCKFPVGAAPAWDMAAQLFCCRARADGSPYCVEHSRVADGPNWRAER